MDLRHLEYFIVVAEELNFSRAAERLHTAQSSLSHQIRHLEEIIGTPLFYRDRHRVELLAAGRAFLDDARRVVKDLDRGIEHARTIVFAETGGLSIGIVPGMEVAVFPYFMPRLRAEFPGFQFRFLSDLGPALMNALRQGIVDLVFHGDPIQDPQIASKVIIRHAAFVALSANSPLASLERIPVRCLASEPFIQPRSGTCPGPILINEVAARDNISFGPAIDCDGMLATITAVSSGLGFAIMPDYMLGTLPPTVVGRPLDINPQLMFPLSVAYRRNETLPSLKIFLKILRENLRKQEITKPAELPNQHT